VVVEVQIVATDHVGLHRRLRFSANVGLVPMEIAAGIGSASPSVSHPA